MFFYFFLETEKIDIFLYERRRFSVLSSWKIATLKTATIWNNLFTNSYYVLAISIELISITETKVCPSSDKMSRRLQRMQMQ